MPQDATIVDAETIKITYEGPANTTKSNKEIREANFSNEENIISSAQQEKLSNEGKLYRNRVSLSKDDLNILPKVKMKKLDALSYRKRTSSSMLIKNPEKHNIRNFEFANVAKR